MNREQYLLMKVMEECSELAVRASKAARFGLNQEQPEQDAGDNRERIIGEFNDLVAVLQMLDLDPFKIINSDFVERHKQKVERYMSISMNFGKMEKEDRR